MKTFATCPICANSSLKKIYIQKWGSSNFAQCATCKVIFQNPQEAVSITKERYNEEYFRYEFENEENFFKLVGKTFRDFQAHALLHPGAKVLEIGCATGLFLKYMEELGFEATGVEVCQESCEYGRSKHGVDIFNGVLEEAKFADETFDFIHFSHLIEHLNDPRGFLKEVKRILKKSGFVIVTTPNSSGLFSKFFNEDWRCIVDDHLFLFNTSNLKLLLEQNGFIVDEIITWGSVPKWKYPSGIKKMMDSFVKTTNTGDVVSMLAFVKNGFV